MAEPPERLSDTATPTEILERLDLFRERYRTGLMNAAAFNDALKAFQFTDEIGHLWAPGVNSNRWYRWDRTEWTAADPPVRLNLPGMPIMFTRDGVDAAETAPRPSQPEGPPQARPSSPESRRPQVKTSAPPARPAALPAAPQPVPPAQPVPPTAVLSAGPKFCPQCGAPAAGKKFCSKCGRKLG